jgi:hypothetical protein
MNWESRFIGPCDVRKCELFVFIIRKTYVQNSLRRLFQKKNVALIKCLVWCREDASRNTSRFSSSQKAYFTFFLILIKIQVIYKFYLNSFTWESIRQFSSYFMLSNIREQRYWQAFCRCVNTTKVTTTPHQGCPLVKEFRSQRNGKLNMQQKYY